MHTYFFFFHLKNIFFDHSLSPSAIIPFLWSKSPQESFILADLFPFCPFPFSLKFLTAKLSPYHSSKTVLVKWWPHFFIFFWSKFLKRINIHCLKFLSSHSLSNLFQPPPLHGKGSYWVTSNPLVVKSNVNSKPLFYLTHQHCITVVTLHTWLPAHCTLSGSLLPPWSLKSPLLVLLLPDLITLETPGLSLSILTPLVISSSPLALIIMYTNYSKVCISVPDLSWAPDSSCPLSISTRLSNSHLKLNMSESKLLVFLQGSASSQPSLFLLLATPSYQLFRSKSMESSSTSLSLISHV